MKSPIIRYTLDQKRAMAAPAVPGIALLEKHPLTRDELLAHFPGRNKCSLAAMLRTPTQTGKIFVNFEGKYEVYSPPPGLKVIQGQQQPYNAPPKLEFIYEVGLFHCEKY